MRRISIGNWQRLAVLQQLPRYEEYLALGDEVCATLSFQDYYTINFGSQPKDLDENLLKGIVGGVKKDEHEVQVVGELHLELTIHDENVHEEIALEPSCESSNTSTFTIQIMDKPCDELELVHSSSPTAGIQTVMTGEIHEVQGNECRRSKST